MTIGVPIWQGRVSPVLDTATRLLVLKCRDRKEIGRQEILLGVLDPKAFARRMGELEVDILLCAALSEELDRALRRQEVLVYRHICGETERVLRAFCCKRLADKEFRMPGCWGWRFHSKGNRGRKSAGRSARVV
jgi:hypothetical protein